MKKILLISNMYPSNKDKHYGVFVRNVYELLKNNDFIIDRVVMIKHHNKFIKLFSYIIFHLKVILLGLFKNYDYLYVHFISHSSLGAIIVKRIKKNTKLILNCHGNDIVSDLKSENNNIKRSHRYIKYADKVIVPSLYFKNIIRNEYKISDSKIFIYPSGGVNTNIFIKKDMNKCKNKLNLDLNINYIGYISRLEVDKGWDTFLYMIKGLDKKDLIEKYNLKFIVVGNGSLEKDFFKLTDELNIQKYIEYKNMVNQDELVNIYNSLEIFIFPTRRKSESLGLVGIEAMACETFVIASDSYGPTDYVVNEENGLTFKTSNYKDLVLKVKKYFELDNNRKNKILKCARQTALRYDINDTKDKIIEVFK